MAKKKTDRQLLKRLIISKADRQRLRARHSQLVAALTATNTACLNMQYAYEALLQKGQADISSDETLQRLHDLAGLVGDLTDEQIVDALEYWLNEQVVATVEGDGCDLRVPGPGLNDREGLDPNTLIV